MMGFAALYPSYGLKPIRRMGRAKGETHRFARRGPGRGMMGFAALYPSYGLKPIRRMGRAKGETHRFARRGPGRGMMGFAALYPSYGLKPIRRMGRAKGERSEEHTSEFQSLMCTSNADFCSKKKKSKTSESTTNNVRS